MTITTDALLKKKSAHCAPDSPPLTDAQLVAYFQAVPEWQRDGQKITREYKFKDHYQTQAFTNAVMWVSHREDHHPMLTVGYNTCRVELWTHTVGGLSDNDFICAAKIDLLFGL